jgi:hypothetical protein
MSRQNGQSIEMVAAKRGKVLLVLRRSDGLWMFPGGRRRPSETEDVAQTLNVFLNHSPCLLKARRLGRWFLTRRCFVGLPHGPMFDPVPRGPLSYIKLLRRLQPGDRTIRSCASRTRPVGPFRSSSSRAAPGRKQCGLSRSRVASSVRRTSRVFVCLNRRRSLMAQPSEYGF